ncbi:MAG: AMP-binding protein [Planctomycetota bacterium]
MNAAIVRRILIPLHERLIGRQTLRFLSDMEASQWWPREKLLALQREKLRRLLQHAHAKTPFHRDRIDKAGINPDSVSLDDLHRLRLLNKADIAAHLPEMIDASVTGGLHDCTTGGSTGAPLAFKMDRSRQAADQAARARSRRWFGIELGEREAYLWGSPIEQTTGDVIKTVRDRLTNHRLLNAFNMTLQSMASYLTELSRFDPVNLFGYPSSLSRLVRFGVDSGRPVRNSSLRAVFTTGELLAPPDRAILEEHLGVPVADGYGSREGGFIAHQCPQGSYHITMESVIVELVDSEGHRVENGQSGEIVVTHLDAVGMPFIRYRTGDIARRSMGACPCGRGLDTLDLVEGRRTDALRRADGGYAHALSVIYVLRNEPAVAEFKVTQRRTLDLDVDIVPRGPLDAASQFRMAQLLSRQIGGAQVRLHLTESITPDPSGKHRHVVSEAT